MKTSHPFLALFLLVLLASPTASLAGALIIDHRGTAITEIPLAAIQEAKASLHIVYGHTSHGSQLTDGMTGLVDFANAGGKGLAHPANAFAWSNANQSPDRLHLSEALSGDCGYYPQWVNETRTYLGAPEPGTGRGQAHPECNVVIWSWCGQVAEKYRSGTLHSEYLTPMSSLEMDYPGVAFVYMTGHVDHWDDADNKAANAVIRDYCQTNGKILYDFADIESHDPDGTFYEFPNDNCDYYASATGPWLGNWATEWQDAHTEGVDWYTCDAAHSEPLNANQKAYAAWWLWARLAGWPSQDIVPPTLELTVDETTVALSWNTVPNATGYTLYYAPAPYTGPDSIQGIDMGNQTGMSVHLWNGASFFVAVKAYDSVGSSDYSNIEHFYIP
ncbi:MAG: hypothetical protein QG552_2172 [Thermodesulfobacteriota bacterium]|nr:hypothetical protein [Thermodesulfobacteriota bacterium]